jgi:hypothetical protein
MTDTPYMLNPSDYGLQLGLYIMPEITLHDAYAIADMLNGSLTYTGYGIPYIRDRDNRLLAVLRSLD